MEKLIISLVAVVCLTGMVFGATPLLHYQFESDITDSAGSNDGTWEGGDGSSNTFAAGQIDNALYLDGSGGVLASGVFGDMAGKTMVCWIKIDSDSGNMHFFSSSGGGSRFYVSRVVWGGQTGLTLASNTGPTDEWFGLVDYTIGDWAHVAISVSTDASPVSTMYVDGALVGASTDSGVNIDGLRLGSSGTNWQGALDDFAIIDGVLGVGEIANIITYGVAGSIPKAHTPDPKNNAPDVAIDKTLGWAAPGLTSGTDPVTYEVYYTDANSLSGASAQIPTNGGQDIFLDPAVDFVNETTYLWRVDVTDPNTGGTPVFHEGDVWTFTTAPSRVIASNPIPDGTTADPSVTLVWDSDAGAVANEVYLRQPNSFDNEWKLIKTLATSGPGTSYTPSDDVEMEWSEPYEWSIDTVFEDPAETLEGDVWTFTTTTPECNGGERLPGDEDDDCDVDLVDFAIGAGNWMACGWEPAASCGVWPYPQSSNITITTHMEIWIRSVAPDATYENDGGGIYSSATGGIRATLVEFDLSALEGKTLTAARLYAYNLSNWSGNADPCKSHAFIIDPNQTAAGSSTWNTYQAEYAGTEVALDLGAFDVPAGAPSVYFVSTLASAADLDLIEAETIANGGDGILTLVLIADEDGNRYRFDIGDDPYYGDRMYLEFLTE